MVLVVRGRRPARHLGARPAGLLAAPAGSRLDVRIGDVTASALVADGTGDVAHGELALAPISPGWHTRGGAPAPFVELAVRGGSAAQRFGDPAPGTPIALS